MGRAAFYGPLGVYRADTCAPLRQAADAGEVKLWAYGRDAYPGQRLPRGVFPGLRSVGLWSAATDQNWGLDWHRNEGIEVTCVTGGRTMFSCEGQDYELPSGYVTVTRPWQLHRVGAPTITASTLCWFILDVGVRRPNQDWRWPGWLPIPDSGLRRITELLRHNERPVWPASKGMLSAVERLDHTLRADVSAPLSRIGLGVGELLVELAELLEGQQPQLDPYLSSSERMVALFLRGLPETLDEEWTTEMMAAECGMGKTRFAHYCRQLVNVSPMEHLIALRIQRAQHLLATTDETVSSIASQCGFRTSQYFSTVFRRRVDCTPSEFRMFAGSSSSRMSTPSVSGTPDQRGPVG